MFSFIMVRFSIMSAYRKSIVILKKGTKKGGANAPPFCGRFVLEPESRECEVESRAGDEHQCAADLRALGRGQVHSRVHGHYDVLLEGLYERQNCHYAQRTCEGNRHSVEERDVAEFPLQETVDDGACEDTDCARKARSPLREHTEDEYRQDTGER